VIGSNMASPASSRQGRTPCISQVVGVPILGRCDESPELLRLAMYSVHGIVGTSSIPWIRAAIELYSGSGSAAKRCSMSIWPARSSLFRFFRAEQIFLSSPSDGVKGLVGRPPAISPGVAPSRLLPTLIWWSRKESGLPGSRASSHRLTRPELGGHRVRSTPYSSGQSRGAGAC